MSTEGVVEGCENALMIAKKVCSETCEAHGLAADGLSFDELTLEDFIEQKVSGVHVEKIEI